MYGGGGGEGAEDGDEREVGGGAASSSVGSEADVGAARGKHGQQAPMRRRAWLNAGRGKPTAR